MITKIRCVRYLVLVAAVAGVPGGSLHSLVAQESPAPDASVLVAVPQSPSPRLFADMGNHTRKVATASPEAQRFFDQGLTWAYSFNHDEAIRSFTQAVKLDPDCAMAYWGIALSHGPHINNPVMDEPGSIAAWVALQKALALSAQPGVDPVERALITALAARYTDPVAGKLPFTADERRPLDEAYAKAMQAVFTQFPTDADVVTLYAESRMDLHPWDFYAPGTQEPRPWTAEIVTTLEQALRLDPDHPGANHYYIHAVEASRSPERANAAADYLRTLVRASGHMVHMPAHIDVRTGRWAQAAEQNRQATRIDAAYRAMSPQQGIYRIYMAHNDHFLAWACMMLGRREEAQAAARNMTRNIPADFLQAAAPFVDPLTSIELSVLMRFGRWDEIIAVPRPADYLPVTGAMWRFARGSAFAAQGKVDEALAEQSELRKAVLALPEGAMLQQNTAVAGLRVAELTLDGEIAFRQGRLDAAIAALTQAVEQEDTLRYMEPPDWLQPARHALGAVLVSAKRFADAEAVYREDLKRWPENGWALHGLAQSLAAQDSPETDAVQARFEHAWAQADTEITASCLCVTDVK